MVMASLVVSGDDWSPPVLSSALGIQPTSTRIKGQATGPKRPPAPYTEWIYETPKAEYDNVDEPIRRLLAPFVGKSDILSGFAKQHRLAVTLNCVIEVDQDFPELYVSAENVCILGALRANLGFDLSLSRS
jgi:hypothetical protein